MKKVWFIVFSFLIVAGAGPQSSDAATTHADRISRYEGARTCGTCHEQAAREVAVSLHYQQQAEVPYVKDWPKGQTAGMMVSY